jgi:hypothetical protein
MKKHQKITADQNKDIHPQDCPDSFQPDSIQPDSIQPDSIQPDSIRTDSIQPADSRTNGTDAIRNLSQFKTLIAHLNTGDFDGHTDFKQLSHEQKLCWLSCCAYFLMQTEKQNRNLFAGKRTTFFKKKNVY